MATMRSAVATERWIPPPVDASRPNIARVYDCFLGGTDNFAVDRELAAQVLSLMPDAPRVALDNRAFLRRVVHHLAGPAGIRQFLDIGSGLPTQWNVHQAANEVAPSARVVYVDNDPMVVAHTRALLTGTPNAAIIRADLRRPEEILTDPTVKESIDFTRPVGLLLSAIVHHLTDEEDPDGIVARLRDALPAGSYLALSHFRNPGAAHPQAAAYAAAGEKLLNERLGTGRWRTHQEILAYFGDLELIDPGLVPLSEWRPDPGTARYQTLAHHNCVGGVARKN
jgi:S-adenosyl methyltransferase